MPDTIRCPGCGQENPAASPRCAGCGHPLPPAVPAGDGAPPAGDEPVIFLRRPVRRPRPRPVLMNPLVLWGSVAAVVAVALAYNVYTGAYRRGAAPIAGANAAQQRAADSLRAVLDRDSTDVDANVAFGDILYDTANWEQAAGYYERALARDSGRVRSLVDLGVCRYNLGETDRAEGLLRLALRREPGNAVALYNLGVLRERAGDDAGALRCFHEALAAGATGPAARAVVQHLQDIQRRTERRTPPPAPGRRPAGGEPRAAKGRT